VKIDTVVHKTCGHCAL